MNDKERLNAVSRIMLSSPYAARLYSFLSEHVDDGGIVLASRATIAAHLGIAEITVRRAADFLESQGELIQVKIGGGVYAYALNVEPLKKSLRIGGECIALNAKVLAPKDRYNRDVGARLRAMKAAA